MTFNRNPSFFAELVDLCRGKAREARFADAIVARFVAGRPLMERNGHQWAVGAWDDETGLSKDQQKRAVSALKRMGLIELKQMPLSENGRFDQRVRFVRPVGDLADLIERRRVGSAEVRHSGGAEVPPSGGADMHPSGGAKVRLHKGNKEGSKKESNESVAPDGANGVNNKAKTKTFQGDKPKRDIEKAFRNAVEKHRPDWKVPPFTGPDWNAADTIHKVFGSEAPEAVAQIVEEWSSFSSDVAKHKGNSNKMPDPDIRLLAYNATVALNFWEGCKDEMKKQKAKQSKEDDGPGFEFILAKPGVKIVS